jgi:hypothetical protein
MFSDCNGVMTKTVGVRVSRSRLWVSRSDPWVYRSDRIFFTPWVCRTHCPCVRLTKYKTSSVLILDSGQRVYRTEPFFPSRLAVLIYDSQNTRPSHRALNQFSSNFSSVA